MSRIEEAWKIQRSIERGEPQPTFYMGEFKPDIRMVELHDRLQKYYDETPNEMNNKDALIKWKEFKEWCSYFGYSQDAINQAKRGKFNFD